eukprot:Awhi_evm1s4326
MYTYTKVDYTVLGFPKVLQKYKILKEDGTFIHKELTTLDSDLKIQVIKEAKANHVNRTVGGSALNTARVAKWWDKRQANSLPLPYNT